MRGNRLLPPQGYPSPRGQGRGEGYHSTCTIQRTSHPHLPSRTVRTISRAPGTRVVSGPGRGEMGEIFGEGSGLALAG
jgi:hypothetical protein